MTPFPPIDELDDPNRREIVQAWRWDYLTRLGWLPSSGSTRILTGRRSSQPLGWYRRERAVCLLTDHYAPSRDCVCGLHAVEFLSPEVADNLARLDANRARSVRDGYLPDDETLVVALSRVELWDVLPTAWPDDAAARASHRGAIPDPPGTLRAHRRIYREVLIDREWPSLPDAWPSEVMPEDGVRYVPDLAGWVREQCAAGHTAAQTFDEQDA